MISEHEISRILREAGIPVCDVEIGLEPKTWRRQRIRCHMPDRRALELSIDRDVREFAKEHCEQMLARYAHACYLDWLHTIDWWQMVETAYPEGGAIAIRDSSNRTALMQALWRPLPPRHTVPPGAKQRLREAIEHLNRDEVQAAAVLCRDAAVELEAAAEKKRINDNAGSGIRWERLPGE